jgi:hypothetical protein
MQPFGSGVCSSIVVLGEDEALGVDIKLNVAMVPPMSTAQIITAIILKNSFFRLTLNKLYTQFSREFGKYLNISHITPTLEKLILKNAALCFHACSLSHFPNQPACFFLHNQPTPLSTP